MRMQTDNMGKKVQNGIWPLVSTQKCLLIDVFLVNTSLVVGFPKTELSKLQTRCGHQPVFLPSTFTRIVFREAGVNSWVSLPSCLHLDSRTLLPAFTACELYDLSIVTYSYVPHLKNVNASSTFFLELYAG